MRTSKQPGLRTFVPRWLSDPDMMMPCPCGEPAERHMMMSENPSTGAQRMWHVPCWQSFMQYNSDNDDD